MVSQLASNVVSPPNGTIAHVRMKQTDTIDVYQLTLGAITIKNDKKFCGVKKYYTPLLLARSAGNFLRVPKMT